MGTAIVALVALFAVAAVNAVIVLYTLLWVTFILNTHDIFKGHC